MRSIGQMMIFSNRNYQLGTDKTNCIIMLSIDPLGEGVDFSILSRVRKIRPNCKDKIAPLQG